MELLHQKRESQGVSCHGASVWFTRFVWLKFCSCRQGYFKVTARPTSFSAFWRKICEREVYQQQVVDVRKREFETILQQALSKPRKTALKTYQPVSPASGMFCHTGKKFINDVLFGVEKHSTIIKDFATHHVRLETKCPRHYKETFLCLSDIENNLVIDPWNSER